MRILAVVVCVLASGCYFYYPRGLPKVNGALVVEGEDIRFSTRKVQKYDSCSDRAYKADECELIHGKLKRPYSVYYAKASYGGRDLTRAEFYELVMPDYAARMQKIADLKGVCTISLVPSVIAVAAAVVGFAGPLFLSTKFTDDEKKVIYYTGAGVALGMGLLSYPIGGFACTKALGLTVDYADRKKEWGGNSPLDFAAIEKLADDFNARRGSGAPTTDTPTEDAAPEAPVDEPPAAAMPVAPTGGGLLGVVSDAGQFSTFLSLVDKTGESERLDEKGPYTVFAPTDAAFAKLPAGDLDRLTKSKLRTIVLRHVIKGKFTPAEMVAKAKLKSVRGKDLAVTRSGKTIEVDGGVITEPGLTATNGVVYAIDTVLLP